MALFALILTAIQIKGALNSHYNKDKLELKGIGRRGGYYWVRIGNKKEDVALILEDI